MLSRDTRIGGGGRGGGWGGQRTPQQNGAAHGCTRADGAGEHEVRRPPRTSPRVRGCGRQATTANPPVQAIFSAPPTSSPLPKVEHVPRLRQVLLPDPQPARRVDALEASARRVRCRLRTPHRPHHHLRPINTGYTVDRTVPFRPRARSCLRGAAPERGRISSVVGIFATRPPERSGPASAHDVARATRGRVRQPGGAPHRRRRGPPPQLSTRRSACRRRIGAGAVTDLSIRTPAMTASAGARVVLPAGPEQVDHGLWNTLSSWATCCTSARPVH